MEIRKKKECVQIFQQFCQKMHNKVYFTETKPGVCERNARFKLKTNFVANIQYKEIDSFGWRVREKINEVIERVVKQKFGQNMSNKEKSALGNLIHAKNKSIVINDTDKNMGAADADKKDVIEECERQLGDIKTYFKISEEELKQFITEIQNKLKRVVESHVYKGNYTRKEAEFLMSKMYVYDLSLIHI